MSHIALADSSKSNLKQYYITPISVPLIPLLQSSFDVVRALVMVCSSSKHLKISLNKMDGNHLSEEVRDVMKHSSLSFSFLAFIPIPPSVFNMYIYSLLS